MVAAGNGHRAETGDGTRGGRALELADPAVPAELAGRIVESMPMAFLALDKELRYLAINAQAETFFGRSRNDIIGKRVSEVFPASNGLTFDAAARKALTEQADVEYELYHPPADRWYENHLIPMEGGLWAFLRDVTERKRAEFRLEAQHAVTRALAESSTLPEATPRILRSLCRNLGWELAQLWGVDGEGMRWVETWRSPVLDAGRFSALSRETRFGLGSGLPGRVWSSGEPAWITDVTTDGNFPRAAAAREDGLHTAAAFPIPLNGEVLGIIEFFTRATREPDRQVLEMMSAVGTQIGQFIERTQAWEAVSRSEGRKSAILESSMDCVISMDHEGRIVDFNPAAEKAFGYARDEVVGKVMADLIVPPSLREQHKHGLAQYLQTGESAVLGRRRELTAMRSDGSEFPIELAATRVDLPGAPLFTAYIRDITEQKREQELSSRLAALVESSDDAIIGKTLGGVITSWNAAADRLYGYRWEEVAGQSISMLIPPDRADEFRSILGRLERGEPIDHFETVRLAKDGTRIDVSLTVSPIRSAAGAITGASTIARDITERKLAEKDRAALLGREQAARLGAERATRMLQRLQRVTDVALAHLELDDLLDELLKRTRDLLQADTATMLLVEDQETLVVRASSGLRSEVDAGVRVRIGEGITGRIAESREPVVVKDVSRVPVVSALLKHNIASLIGVPLINKKELLGVLYLGTFTRRDFTDEDLRLLQLVAERVAQAIAKARLYEEVGRLNEELERRVVERTAQLEEANQELEGFSYSVSHDLRAPLRVIDGFSRILLTEHGAELSEDAGRYLDMVRDGAQQMGQLIDDLLVYARLGRKSLETQTVDPAELVRSCLESLREHQQDRQVEVDIGYLPPCEGDPVLLKQVFLNLLENALKYTRTRTVARIEVGCEDVDGQPTYFVRDNGVGFDMEYADKLFGVFQRMHKAEEYEGTGVGLAIVQRAIHRHGGRVWAQSSPDEGTAFYFALGGGTPVE